jgi:hypothetical protein
MVWTNSWPSIVGACCDLICVGACEEQAWKVYTLRGLRAMERQVGSARGTHWPVGSTAATWWQEKQDEIVDRSRCMIVAHDRSMNEGFAAVQQKTVGLLGWATKRRPKARRVKTGSKRVEKLRCRRTRGGITGLTSGGHELRQRRGHAMKRSSTWPNCPRGVCISV